MSGYTYDTEFMRNAVGYVPTQTVRMKWNEEDAAGFDAWLAQVRCEAQAEAWEATTADVAVMARAMATYECKGKPWDELHENVREVYLALARVGAAALADVRGAG